MGGWGLKTLVIVTGVIGAIVWAIPSLVTLGLFLLVIPGLILMIMPTLFVYLLLALLIRSVLPFGGFGATALALGLAVAIGFVVPQPFRAMQTARYTKAMLPEIVPDKPVALAGEILVLTRKREGFSLGQPRCEALCAALLATPGVTGVTLRYEIEGKQDTKQTRFALDPERAGMEGGPAPSNPENIVEHWPEEPDKPGDKLTARSDNHQLRRKAVISDWTLRLATEAGLVEGAAGAAHDWMIAITDGVGGKGNPKIDRLEVTSSSDKPVLRRSLVAQRLMAVPFHFGFTGSLENAHFEVAHTRLANGPSYPYFDAIRELLLHTSMAEALPSADQADELRRALSSMLDDPAPPPALAGLARGWMDSLPYQPSDDDRALINRIIADQRITDIRQQVRRFYEKKAPAELRAPLVARILNPASKQDERRDYAFLLSKLPEGSFATMSADEQKIVGDPALRRQAAALIERLGDQGQPGLAKLMAILETEIASNEQWAVQRRVIRSVRRGLARLGPQAASALPRIEELFARQRNPLANLYQEAEEWRIAMARMGKPIDELPFGSYDNPERLQRDKDQIRKRLETFDPAWESGYSY